MNQMAWRKMSTLPTHSGGSWAVLRRGKLIPCSGLGEVMTYLRNWFPASRILVAAPDADRFAPPACLDDLCGKALSATRRATAITVISGLLLGCLATALFCLRPAPLQAGAALIGLFLVTLSWGDYWLFLRHRAALIERALFFNWIYSSSTSRRAMTSLVIFVLAIGLMQLLLQEAEGGFEPMFVRYGALYGPIADGQWWRLFVGPFFHSSLAHYLTNAIFLCSVGSLAWAVFGQWTFLAFLLGSVAGAVGALLFHGGTVDGYAGVSGGVFALCGLVIALGTLDKKSLPKGFAILVLGLTVMSILLPTFSSAKTSMAGHVAGLLFGLAAGALGYRGAIGTKHLQPPSPR